MEAIWYRSQWLHWSKWTEGKFSTALNQMLRSTDTCLFIWSYVTSNMQCLIYYKYCFNLLSYLFYAFFLFSPPTHIHLHINTHNNRAHPLKCNYQIVWTRKLHVPKIFNLCIFLHLSFQHFIDILNIYNISLFVCILVCIFQFCVTPACFVFGIK